MTHTSKAGYLPETEPSRLNAGEELVQVIELAEAIMDSRGISVDRSEGIHTIFRPITPETPVTEPDLKEEI